MRQEVGMQQVFEDVAHNILALLLVVEQRSCQPIHIGIVVSEQVLYICPFHLVFYYQYH